MQRKHVNAVLDSLSNYCPFSPPDGRWMESDRDTPCHDHSQKPGSLPVSNEVGNGEATPTSPPYWQFRRSVSRASVDNNTPLPISLEDHSEAHSDTSGTLWARDITIEDYVIVRGGSTGIGAYVVWNCKVQTINVGAGNATVQVDLLLTLFN